MSGRLQYHRNPNDLQKEQTSTDITLWVLFGKFLLPISVDIPDNSDGIFADLHVSWSKHWTGYDFSVPDTLLFISTSIQLVTFIVYFLWQQLGISTVLFQVHGVSDRNGRMLIPTLKENCFKASGWAVLWMMGKAYSFKNLSILKEEYKTLFRWYLTAGIPTKMSKRLIGGSVLKNLKCKIPLEISILKENRCQICVPQACFIHML